MTDGVFKRLRKALGKAPGENPSSGKSAGKVQRQFGAIPWRHGADGIEFLLITTRRTGRWIFPKGGQIALLSPQDSAAQEAFEEAGVEGTIEGTPVGHYRGIKRRDRGDVKIEVQMYPLEVTVEMEDWPEKGQRRREWAGTEQACAMISEPDLVPMIRLVAEAASGAGAL